MKASRSRLFAFVLLCVLILASSLPAMQKALGGSQTEAWVNARFLPLVMNDPLSAPSATPTFTPTATASPTLTGTPTPSATPTDTPTSTATPTDTPSPSATPICHLPSPTPACTSTSTSTQDCTPTPIHPPIFTPTGAYIPALKLTVTQSPLTIFPPVMIFTAELRVMIPIPSTGVKVDFYNLAGTGLEYLGSGMIGNHGEAVLNKQMCPGKYTTIARAEVNSLVLWSNAVAYTVY